MQWIGRYLDRNASDGENAPQDQDHDHYRGDNHDLDSFFAGFVNSLHILAPKIDHDESAKHRRECIFRESMQRMTAVASDIFNKSSQVLSRNYRADRSSQDIVKQ